MRITAALLALCVTPVPCVAQAPSSASASWIASWTTSVQGPEASQPPVDPAKLSDSTIRQVVHLSTGGTAVRVQFSNAFGSQPLEIDSATVALTAPDLSGIEAGSSHRITFSGNTSVLIPCGASFVSDPVALAVKPLSNLSITIHLPSAPSVQSAHPGSRATSYLLRGDHVSDIKLPEAEKIVRWMQIAEVDVSGRADRTVVALGDSITDGHGATTDGNDRWPDALAAHLQSAGMTGVGVANEGIGGNHLLTDGLGQSLLERFDRDVLAVAGVRYVLLLEGINDLGSMSEEGTAAPEQHADIVARLEAAYSQVIERAHAHGIKAYGATVTPDTGSEYYHPTATDDADRQALNAWIRQPGHFDGFVDFDAITRDPAHPNRLLPAYDSGDHLHPGPAGYKAMGDAVPLNWFR